jgi:hypothetical protein
MILYVTVLLILPFFKVLKFGDFELQKELEDTQEELKEFKKEYKLELNNILLNKISNNIYIEMPKSDELENENKIIEQKTAGIDFKGKKVKDIEEELAFDDEAVLNLSKIRIKIEQQLREILNLRKEKYERNIKSISLKKMVNLFIEKYPGNVYLLNSFESVIDVCNAAIHGQYIQKDEAKDVMQLAAKLIMILDFTLEKEEPNK